MVPTSIRRPIGKTYLSAQQLAGCPVTIGDGSNTAAGSTINQDVDKSQLAVARARQRNIDGWKRPVKIKKT